MVIYDKHPLVSVVLPASLTVLKQLLAYIMRLIKVKRVKLLNEMLYQHYTTNTNIAAPFTGIPVSLMIWQKCCSHLSP